MASLSQLPVELVEHIYNNLAQPDLYAVSRVCKGFSNLVIPFLYRDVDLSSKF